MTEQNVAELARRLRQVPTSSAKQILTGLGINRVVAKGLRMIVPPEGGIMAGRARTVRFLPLREDVKAPNGAVNRRLIDQLNEHDVVVEDTAGCMEGSVLGDMLAARAKYCGAAGVVADGVVRDVVGLTAVGLPVFARGVHPDPNSVTLLPWETDIAVQLGGALVQPGDWILADVDSVIVIPPHLAEEVAQQGEQMNLEDVFCQKLIAAGYPIDDAYPLPAMMKPHLERFARDGYVPSHAEVK
ncbi:MAG TPA: hypothetical protein VFN74_22350 [Chloroflexota bacterium]|nr:hypothetical protein [Chloroflexota bacterium]